MYLSKLFPFFYYYYFFDLLRFLQLQQNDATFTHTFYSVFFLHSSIVYVFFFSLSILFCFSICFFHFSFTVHLHRTDHLSWYVWRCVCMCESIQDLYIYISSWTDQHTGQKYIIKRQIFLSFICSCWYTILYMKFRLVLSFEIGAFLLLLFLHSPKTICQ